MSTEDKPNPRYRADGKLSLAYRKWSGMRQRVTNPNHAAHKYYAGVTICERWKSFDNFFADMGEPPAGSWLDRIDNNHGYEPGNCQWVTRVRWRWSEETASATPVLPQGRIRHEIDAG